MQWLQSNREAHGCGKMVKSCHSGNSEPSFDPRYVALVGPDALGKLGLCQASTLAGIQQHLGVVFLPNLRHGIAIALAADFDKFALNFGANVI